MPRISPETARKTQVLIKKEKVFTLSYLISLLGCSSRAAQTKLQQWQTYTSYNKNSKYYAMPDIPHFNVHGLWHYKGISFSKNGGLKETVVNLICRSDSGLSGAQIGKLVNLPPQSFLHHFRNVEGIRRKKQEGVFIYFSADPDRYHQQVKKGLAAVSFPVKSLSDAQAITILIALIKHHDMTVDDILALPEVKKNKLSFEIIQGFLEYHGLLKKTPDIRP